MDKICARPGCGCVIQGSPSYVKKRKYCSQACNAMVNFGIKGKDVWVDEAAPVVPEWMPNVEKQFENLNNHSSKPSISELKDLIKSVESKPLEVKEYTKEELMRFKRQRIRKQNGCVQEEINGVLCYVDDDGKEV